MAQLNRRKIIKFSLALVLLASVPADRAMSYRPSAERILSIMSKNFRAIEDLTFEKQDIIYDADTGGELNTYDAQGFYLTPEKFRDEVETPSGKTVTVVDRDYQAFYVGEKLQQKSRVVTSVELMFLIDKTSRLLDILNQLSISTEVVGYGRLEGRIAYTIGVPGEGHDGPQMWIDKKLGLPLRLIISVKGGSTMRIEYREWEKIGDNAHFPRSIYFYNEQGLTREWRIGKTEINTGIKSSLFAVRQLFATGE
jgi:outer membrane lipoprotein-sorting protein